MGTVFVEVILGAADAESVGLKSRDEIEDPLSEALEDSGMGEVTGGGGGSGVYVIDVELDDDRFDAALGVVRSTLRGLGLSRGTVKRRGPNPRDFGIREDP